MESISSAPEMTEIYVDNLPGIRCVYLDVILPTCPINTQQQTWYEDRESRAWYRKKVLSAKDRENNIAWNSSEPHPAYICDFPYLEPKAVHNTQWLV